MMQDVGFKNEVECSASEREVGAVTDHKWLMSVMAQKVKRLIKSDYRGVALGQSDGKSAISTTDIKYAAIRLYMLPKEFELRVGVGADDRIPRVAIHNAAKIAALHGLLDIVSPGLWNPPLP